MQTEHIAVSMGWRLPDASRLRVTYNSRVVAYEEDKDRWLVVMEELLPDADDSTRLAKVDTDTRSLLASLVGKWAYVPEAAREGITLPLKYETLTGEIRFFYADDPRKLLLRFFGLTPDEKEAMRTRIVRILSEMSE